MRSLFNTRRILPLGLLLTLALANQASLAESNTTFLVDAGTTNTAIYGLGVNGTNNVLIVTNGAHLVNTGAGYIGSNDISRYNRAYISGNGSLWSNENSINVGFYGDWNSLFISQTGEVRCFSCPVGQYSDDNAVTISDGGLLTNSAVLSIGVNGRRNSMIVTNRGTVRTGLYISLGASANMDGNQLVVTGTGSVCAAATDLTCGGVGRTNYVTVSNGGSMFIGMDSSGITTIGNRPAARQNRILVTGAGSLYSNRFEIIVGHEGSNNYLTVSDGGRVLSQSTTIGQSNRGNIATIHGAGAVLTNSHCLTVGSTGAFNQLIVSNGGYAIFPTGYVGYTASSSNNAITVSGNGSIVSNTTFLYFGNGGGCNTAVVSEGGKLGATYTYVGIAAGSDNNSINLTGTNSLMKSTQVYLGDSGRANGLTVSNGATLDSMFIFLGNNTGADNNTITADGNGSVITGYYFYAMSAADNRFRVTNSAVIYCQETWLGYNAGGGRNSARIDGEGSRWITPYFAIGNSGASNSLAIYNGGKVACNNGIIGIQSTAANNSALVSGMGSCWSNLNTLYVGYTGSISRLTITNRGSVYAANMGVGHTAESSNNSVSIYNSFLTVTGIYNITRGTNIFDAGAMEIGTLLMTNTSGKMDFRRGLLKAENALVANGSPFYIGNGSATATNLIINNGVHYYANGLGINSNGALAGNGTVVGTALLGAGGFLSPGESIGTLSISNLGVSGGTYVFEKSADAADLITVNNTLTFLGSAQLTVMLRDLGGANFTGTNTLLGYGAISGTPSFAIDYGNTGLAGFTITNNAIAGRIELVSPVAPAAPEALAASGITTNSFTANWSASANATNYFLDVATDSSFSSFVSGYNNYPAGNVLYAVINGLSPNSAYYYRVRAQGLGGTSGNSATITASIYPLPPASAPTGVNATKGAFTDRVRITWNPVTNATSYEVWRNTANDSSGATHLSNDPAATTYDDTAATVGTTYYYWVKAKNLSGTSAFSSPDSGYASSSVSAPSTPTGVSASKGSYSNKVVVSWNTVTNAAGYEVWRNTVNDSSSASKFGAEPSLTSYEDAGVTVQTVYYYWIKAKNSAGTSPFSASDMGFASTSGDTRWLPAPGDLDGDNRTDPTVYQPATGTWKTKLSTANYLTFTTASAFLGGINYAGLAADFDGDAKADPAVYGNTNTLWITRLSSLGYSVATIISFGNSNWTAVAADFDGDRVADPAIYQASGGNWTVKLSTAGYAEIPLPSLLGASGWTAFTADFDGDAKADPAVYESSAGAWSIKLSTAGYAQVDLPAGWMGGDGRLEATGDYDGDGLADPTIYNPATGDWSIKLSSAGYAEIGLTRFLGGME